METLRSAAASPASTLLQLLALFSFSLFAAADVPLLTNQTTYQSGELGTRPNQTFFTSNITVPILQVNRFDPSRIDVDAAPYIFTAGAWDGDWGSIIYSSADLSVVYQDYTWTDLAQATRVWNFKGERVYAALEGSAMRIFNQSYHELYSITPQGDLKDVSVDTHEAVITDDDTVMIIMCPVETVDLTGHGGPDDQQIADCSFQEIDPDTNDVLFQFKSLDFFNPWDSFAAVPDDSDTVWDYAHQNSVMKTADGDYIASYRHLSAVIMVSGSTGNVSWVMGGKRNEFKDVSETDGDAYFVYQHEARFWNLSVTNRFTIFDNAELDNGFCDSSSQNCSRGLELEFDADAKTVRYINSWEYPQPLVSASRGGVQKMDNGHTFVAWGQNPAWTEYDEDGLCILDFQRAPIGTDNDDDHSDLVAYRGYKQDWLPQPPWKPNISAVDNHVYVSWNGLMVSYWYLLVSDNDDDLDSLSKAVARSPRNGFETSFDLADHGSPSYARVAGMSGNNTVLGSTPVVDISSGDVLDQDAEIEQGTPTQEVSTSPGMPVPTGEATPTSTTTPTPTSRTASKSEESAHPESAAPALQFERPSLLSMMAGFVYWMAR